MSSIFSTDVLHLIDLPKRYYLANELYVDCSLLLDKATKEIVLAQNNSQGYIEILRIGGGGQLQFKQPCDLLSDTNVALSGNPTIDGIVAIDGFRILLINQTNPIENGIWEITTGGVWIRPADFENGSDAASVFTFIQQGNVYADTAWVCSDDSANAIVGTDPLTWFQFGSSSSSIIQQGLGIGSSMRIGNNNDASGDYSTALGECNQALSCEATVSGGFCNVSSGIRSTIGGGALNTASCYHATISGGTENSACNFNATIGGGQSNTASGLGSTVSGGAANYARGNYSSIGGGIENYANCSFTTVGGGKLNTACGDYSIVGGGCNNTTFCQYGFIGGGVNNSTSAAYSSIVSGQSNCNVSNYSIIGGGTSNCIEGYNEHSSILGGVCNKIYYTTGRGIFSCANTISGGKFNCTSIDFTTISGGYCNSAFISRSTIGGGSFNRIQCTIGRGVFNTANVIGGGKCNFTTRAYSTVSGGYCNTASGDYSSISGGYNNNTCNFQNAMIVGSNICATKPCTTFVNNLNIVDTPITDAGTLNALVWDPATKEVKQRAISGGGAAIIVPGVGTNSSYRCGSSNSASGNYSTVFGRSNTASGYGDVISGGVKHINNGEHSNIGGGFCSIICNGVKYSSIGGGAFNNIFQGCWSSISGGYYNNVCNCASSVVGGIGNTVCSTHSIIGSGTSNIICNTGVKSGILGGENNFVAHSCSFVIGANITTDKACTTFVNNLNIVNTPITDAGTLNALVWDPATKEVKQRAISGGGSSIIIQGSGSGSSYRCGNDNTASANYSTVSGGRYNIASAGQYSTISGGRCNNVSRFGSVVAGGYCNTSSGYYSTTSGGRCNQALGYCSTISGGECNITCNDYATISGGNCNLGLGSGSTISGGGKNSADDNYSTVSGGYCNRTTARLSIIGGGRFNNISGWFSSILGGTCNTNSGQYSSISGGACNIIYSSACCGVISGGVNNETCNKGSVIGGGRLNCITSTTGSENTISGGYTNIIHNNSSTSTISGGYGNQITGSTSTISGGKGNNVVGDYSFEGGGNQNSVFGNYSTLGGGCNNTTCGQYTAVLGGKNNNTCNFSSAMIIGADICANNSCTAFVNQLSTQNLCVAASDPGICGLLWYDTVQQKLRISMCT